MVVVRIASRWQVVVLKMRCSSCMAQGCAIDPFFPPFPSAERRILMQ